MALHNKMIYFKFYLLIFFIILLYKTYNKINMHKRVRYMNYDYENVLYNQRRRATEEAKLRYRLAPASANNHMNTVRRCLATKS